MIISDHILGYIIKGVSIRSKINDFWRYSASISYIEPKTIYNALLDEEWILAIQEDFVQLKLNDFWDIVTSPTNKIDIGTRSVLRNKMKGNNIITNNKVWLVEKVYNQVEKID